MIPVRRSAPRLAVLLGVLSSSPGAPAQQPAPGLRLLPNQTETHLVDTAGRIVHRWTSAFTAGMSVHLRHDGTLLRAISVGPRFGNGAGGGVQIVAFDGTVLWDYRYNTNGVLSHHDLHPMPNGNVLITAWEDKTIAQAIAAGRDPALLRGTWFRPDHLVEVEPTGPTTGRIVWQWHLWDHLVQDFDPTRANHGDVAAHPELVDINFPRELIALTGDWNHVNGLDYDPANDWIVISAPFQDEIWIIDHSTTTAEAAGHTGGRRGHGGDLLYRWGNPAAYRAGSAAEQQLFFQHDPQFVPPGRPGAGHLTLFNNRWPTGSQIWEIALPIGADGGFVRGAGGRYGPLGPLWTFADGEMNSPAVSGAERLPNGNTLVCSGTQPWLLEVDPAGQIVWQYLPNAPIVFHAHYVERSLWADTSELSSARGGVAGFRLLAGTPRAAQGYLLLASAAGTSPGTALAGVRLPLNVDPLFELAVTDANGPLFRTTLGALDGVGGAAASLAVPVSILPALAGIELDFAWLGFDPVSFAPSFASQPVHLAVRP
ncbi:MAG: aryl-sulfate sulfotransferase [Planctomycetes bacterium]|nr:aryl-sulfate sulfotransferase [Planctomycetota bacterium]